MAIDVTRIADAIMEGSRIRDSKGIIPIFGVYFSLSFVQYYNLLCSEFEKKMGKSRRTEAETHLIKAGQECGYTTFHGIRNSWEWAELVEPMIDSEEDQIRVFAVLAMALGWGDMEVREIIPNEKLLIRVGDSYESAGYSERYHTASSGKCYMLRGVTAAFMDLLYGKDYPDGCFTFSAQETCCRAKGDPYCEFVARKKNG